MEQLSYMQFVVDRNVGMRRMTVMGNMVLANSGFYTRNNLYENNPQFGYTSFRTVCQSFPRPKKIIGLNCNRIFILRGALTCLEQYFFVRRRLVFVYRHFGTAKGN
jgi:hypothetical protein